MPLPARRVLLELLALRTLRVRDSKNSLVSDSPCRTMNRPILAWSRDASRYPHSCQIQTRQPFQLAQQMDALHDAILIRPSISRGA